jgi:hypothetical protein
MFWDELVKQAVIIANERISRDLEEFGPWPKFEIEKIPVNKYEIVNQLPPSYDDRARWFAYYGVY